MDPMFSKSSYMKRHQNNWLDLLIILVTGIVVLRHASIPSWIDQGYPAFDVVGKAIIWVTGIVLPAFLFLAGYLCFRDTPRKPDVRWFGQKYLCGLKRLVIPFLIANVLSWGVYATAYKFAPSMMSGFLDGDWQDPLFVLWKGPINLSLWLLREVIVAFLILPVYYFLIRYTWGAATIAVGVLCAFHLLPETVFWFALGASFAILPLRIQRISLWMEQHPLPTPEDTFDWCYFVFLYHYIPQLVMKKIGVMLLPEINSGGLIAVWLLNALFLVLGLSAIYLLLRRFAPKLLAVVVGSE